MPSIWPWGGLGVALGGLRALPPLFLLSAFCFRFALPPAYGLGDGAKPPENRQSLPVAALHQLWQDGAGMSESEKQFSFNREIALEGVDEVRSEWDFVPRDEIAVEEFEDREQEDGLLRPLVGAPLVALEIEETLQPFLPCLLRGH